MYCRLCVVAALLAPVTVSYLSAAVYYVDSVSGSDVQSGLSASSAWNTLSRAALAPLAPGDYVLLKRGGIWHEPLVVSSSGAPDLPINIGAYGSGATPLIDGGTLSSH